MRTIARSVAASTVMAVVILAGAALPALAKSSPPSKTQAVTTGNDISWPQCGGSYPAGQAFGLVGVNGGLANDQNPCFASELAWAWSSSGKSAPGIQPKASLVVNTADPGQVTPTVADWPTNNTDPNSTPVTDPYGPCSGADDQACAWQYGWNRAIQDMLWLVGAPSSAGSTSPAAYPWWLDVETGNTWETGSIGLANNVADLQGMVAAFTNTSERTPSGAQLGGVLSVGIYSTSSQWGQITGPAASPGSLSGLPDWIPGARTASGAQSNCSLTGFTGHVTITQWFGRPYDGDYACP
jgi:hypothetical protein